MAKRGRGWPPNTVPPPPVNHPQPATNLVVETENHELQKHEETIEKFEATTKSPETLIEEPKEVTNRKLWVDVLNNNRNLSNGVTMEFVAPKLINGEVEVEIEAEDNASELQFWENAMILYVLGGSLSMTMLKNYMVKMWNFVTLPDMLYHDDGYFLLRFKNREDRETVMMRGPYTIRNMPIILKEWTPDFNLSKDLERTMPIWVKLSQLPLCLWGLKSLNKIGSAISNPLMTDECTAQKLRVSYARILVEVDITQKLVEEITISDRTGGKIKQIVEYEWKPEFCEKCQKAGHQCGKKKVVKKWIPRNKQADEVKADPLPKTPVQNTETEGEVKPEGWITVGKAARHTGKAIEVIGKLKEISSHLLKLRPTIAILIETRVKNKNAKKIRDKLKLPHNYLDNYKWHDNGRLWIEWDNSKIDVRHVKCSSQYVHVGVYNLQGEFKFWLTVVGDSKSVSMMMETIRKFSDSTGLKVNPAKCQMFFGGMDGCSKENLRRITDFAEGKLPVRYLGVPLSCKRLTIQQYMPLIDKIVDRVKHWTSKLLSYAGRIQLVKSITSAIAMYWMQCFPLPQFVLRKINAICRSFVWTGKQEISKKSLVAWDTMCRNKSQGGVGIINLQVWNIVSLMKCLWNICRNSENLWVMWVHTYYLKGNDAIAAFVRPNSSWILKNIMNQRDKLGQIQQHWDQALSRQKFPMSAMYHGLTEDHQRVPWRSVMCGNKARLRAVICLWLACHKKLSTKDRLRRFGMIKSSDCSICNCADESINHLFFNCSGTREIWGNILDWLGRRHDPRE
ncbi:putative ribonuclease H protein [Glycine max]|nr:putative ribonuclease H protein [Glycine max]